MSSLSQLPHQHQNEDSNSIVSWQQFQHIYHKITGKKDSLIKELNGPHRYTMPDIEDLHYKIQQTAESYNLKGHNNSVTITYIDDSKPVFSSYEKFKLQAASGATAIKSILLEYNFAFEGSQTKEIDSLKIKVLLISGISFFAEMKRESPQFIWHMYGYPTGNVNIEYVDFAIAQNFMGVISKWFDSVPKAKGNKILRFIQKNSSWVRGPARLVFLALGAFFLIKNVDTFLGADNNILTTKYIIFSVAFIVLMIEAGLLLGRILEIAIDRIWTLAYISLNKGDEALIEEVKHHNNTSMITLGLKGLCFIGIVAITSLVDHLIKYLLL